MKSIDDMKQDFLDGKIGKGLYTSLNEKGNLVIVEVYNSRFTVTTKQTNGWYHVEEYLYDNDVWVYSESYEK